jgi:hypothetical protein
VAKKQPAKPEPKKKANPFAKKGKDKGKCPKCGMDYSKCKC